MFHSDRRGSRMAWRNAAYAIAALGGVMFGFVQPVRAQQAVSTSASAEQCSGR
jgi:hypothetical protein